MKTLSLVRNYTARGGLAHPPAIRSSRRRGDVVLVFCSVKGRYPGRLRVPVRTPGSAVRAGA